MAVTLAEIARQVGVHVSLVSRVLRDDSSAKLSPAKRAQILEVAKATGYRPNRLGRSLRTGRTSIIGVIAPDITNPFYSVMFRGVEAAAAAAGYDTILVNTDNSLERVKEVVSMLAEGHVDGVLIATAKAVDESLDWLAKERLPYVLINRRRIGTDDPWVGPDDFQTGYLGASHLLGLGHRRIAFLLLDLEIGYTAQQVPDFTSIRVPLDEIGRRATDHLIGLLSGDGDTIPLPSAPIPVSLIDMGSTAPPPKRG